MGSIRIDGMTTIAPNTPLPEDIESAHRLIRELWCDLGMM